MIKSRINETTKIKTREYPYIGKREVGNLYCVLFYKLKTGIVIFSLEPVMSVGDFSQNWEESYFEVTEDEILLKNG